MPVEKGILAEELMAGLRRVLDEVEREGAVYFVASYDPESCTSSAFVLGPEMICGRVLGLVDPEYGWPVRIRIEAVHTASMLAGGPRRHPFIYDGNRCLAVGVSVHEYAEIKRKYAEQFSAEDSRIDSVPTLVQRLCSRCGQCFEPADFDVELCPECHASPATTPGQIGSDFSSSRLEMVATSKTAVYCECCGMDASARADSDGRMAELLDVVAYWCPECAGRADPSLGKLSDYHLIKKLGTNGTTSTFRAWHEPTGRVLVIEALSSGANEAVYRRMRNSHLLIADLRHPNLARVLDIGHNLCTMEDFTDGSLESYFELNGPMTPQVATGQMMPVLDALSYLHARGLVHLDVKPMNIMLKRIGTRLIPKLTGLYLARPFGRDRGFDADEPGMSGGTFPFMPPEQLTAFNRCGPSVDTYAAGVSIYYLLTGCYSIEFPTHRELKGSMRPLGDPVRMVLEAEPIPIEERTPLIPAPLARVINRAVRKKSADRYQNGTELRDAIDDAMRQIP